MSEERPVYEGNESREKAAVPYDYRVFSGADQLARAKEVLKEHEKRLFELSLVKAALEGNPETTPHVKPPDDDPRVVCNCRDCELERVNKLLKSTEYAARQVRGIVSDLT